MTSNKRLYSLDLLKFVLSVLVVLHHFQQTTSLRFRYLNFYDGSVNFSYCVELFFIISGFLSAMKEDRVRESSFIDYIVTKLKRFYPMTFLSVTSIIIIDLAYYAFNGNWYNGLNPDIYKVVNSFLLTFAGGAVSCGRGMNNPLWYLCVLLICEMIYWFMVDRCKKCDVSLIVLALLMCSVGVGAISYEIDLPYLNDFTARGYSTFFLGVILFKTYSAVNKKNLYIISGLILAVCIVLASYDYSSFFHYEWGAYTFVVLPCVLFTALSLDKYCRSNAVEKLGGTSFLIYVWHPVFMMLLGLFRSFEFGRNIINTADPFLLMMCFTLTVIVFSITIHIYFEKRINDRIIHVFRKITGI